MFSKIIMFSLMMTIQKAETCSYCSHINENNLMSRLIYRKFTFMIRLHKDWK